MIFESLSSNGKVAPRAWVSARTRRRRQKLFTTWDQTSTPTHPPSTRRPNLRGFVVDLRERITAHWGGHSRRAHLQTLAIDEQSEVDPIQRMIKRNFALSAGALALTTTGALLSLPLSWLSLPVLAFLSIDFLRNGWRSLVQEKRVGMAVVDAIALPGMWISGHFFIASFAYTLYYLGRSLSYGVRSRSEQSLIDVFRQHPNRVWVVRDGIQIEIPFEQLDAGDQVMVEAGGIIPADGTVVAGEASVDQHILTGESHPLEVEAGDSVFASTLVLAGRITIEVERAGEATLTAQIADLLLNTAEYKSTLQSRGEAIADRSASPLLALAALTLPLLGVESALAVLQAGFGYTMRVIAPISTLNFLNIAARQGILIKDGRILESFNQVDTVIFDKTGTLTLDQPQVGQVYAVAPFSEDEVLAYAASAERKQSHPIAQAILRAADDRRLPLYAVEASSVEIGYGIRVVVNGHSVRVGSARFLAREGISIPSPMQTLEADIHQQGRSLVYVVIHEQLVGAIELCPTIRPEARDLIESLQARGLTLVIISGDHEHPTRRLAEDLGIERYYAATLPEHKAGLVAQMQREGRFVCFVGDGINDAVALKQANVSVSLRGAATLATDTAEIVLMGRTLNQLAALFQLTDRFEANMRTNLLSTLLPGVVCIGGVYFLNFGVIAGCILFDLGLMMGLSNAMSPLLKRPDISPVESEKFVPNQELGANAHPD